MINERCKDCYYYLKPTISKPGCKKTGLIRHPLNRICKDFKPIPKPYKINLEPVPHDFLPKFFEG